MLRSVFEEAERRWPLRDEGQRRASRRWSPAGASPATTFAAFVAATFLFGWVAGVLVVVKAWRFFNSSQWPAVSGAGYVTLMLGPILCGVCCSRVASRLVSRGWGGLPLRALALGVCGVVAGLMAI